MLEGRLQEEVAERRRLELELEKLKRGTVTLEEQGERERGRRLSVLLPGVGDDPGGPTIQCFLELVSHSCLHSTIF